MEPLPACLHRLSGPELRDVAAAVLAATGDATDGWTRACLLEDGPHQRANGAAWVESSRRLLVVLALLPPSPVRALVASGQVGGRTYAPTTELALEAHADRTGRRFEQWVSSLPREPHVDAFVRAWCDAW